MGYWSLRSSERGLKLLSISWMNCLMVLSLRSSERGLKYFDIVDKKLKAMSLRSSERGLKSAYPEHQFDSYKSLRSSERGLKYVIRSQIIKYYTVAPFVGAWIEIPCIYGAIFKPSLSLRSSERGLKYTYPYIHP